MSEWKECPRCRQMTQGTWDGGDWWAVCNACFFGELIEPAELLRLNALSVYGERDVFSKWDERWERKE